MADVKRKVVKEDVGYKMEIKLLKSDENKAVYHISDAEVSLVNSLRRAIMEEISTMAIDEITFTKNSSALYDEVLAHRIGLIPFITDLKSYELEDETKPKAKARSKYELKISLSTKGPCTVYASDLKTKDPKIKAVYGETPIVILLKSQELELEATAKLGRGKDHAKFASGLAYYKFYPTLKASKDSNVKKCMEMSKNLVAKGSGLEIKEITEWNEAQEQICEQNNIEVEYNNKEFIFTIESWGQLEVKKLPSLALEIIEDKLKELEKLIK